MDPGPTGSPGPATPTGTSAVGSSGHLSASSLALIVLSACLSAPPLAAQEGAGRPRGCTLRLQPTDSTRARRIETGPQTYITHVWGGLVSICGDARMLADSAVKYDADARLEMIGSVDYRDSTRTLTSRRLEYFQREDRIVATGDVFLTRLESGSTLEGPRVEFFRATGPGPQRTVATGRPHMVFHTDTVPPRDGPPVEVDADEAEFEGERDVRAWGEVVITRPDLTATADSAVFLRDEGTGELFGNPEVTSEGFTLAGDRVRTVFVQGEIDRVEAIGEARASGEGFELYAPHIVARLAGEQVEEMWAFGEGRVAALSESYRLGGDSIRFAFSAGAIDSLRSVGEATAVQVGDQPPDDPRAEPVLDVEGTRSWVVGDTVTLDFEPAEDTASLAGDTTAAGAAVDTTAPPDSAAGDTAAVAASDTSTGPSTAPPTARDTAARARLSTMRAAGSARAYYVLQADSSGTADPAGAARDYMLGREIVVHFRDGNVDRVEGIRAIGIHLDPLQGGAAAGDAGRDTAADTARPDTSAAADSGAAVDTTGRSPIDPGERTMRRAEAGEDGGRRSDGPGERQEREDPG